MLIIILIININSGVLFSNFTELIGTESIQFANGENGQRRRKLHDRSFSHDKLVHKIPMFQEVLCTNMFYLYIYKTL